MLICLSTGIAFQNWFWHISLATQNESSEWFNKLTVWYDPLFFQLEWERGLGKGSISAEVPQYVQSLLTEVNPANIKLDRNIMEIWGDERNYRSRAANTQGREYGSVWEE